MAALIDYDADIPYREVLEALGLPYDEVRVALGGGEASLYDLRLNQVAVTVLPTRSIWAERAPDVEESSFFFELAVQPLERFRRGVALTYGGHPMNLELMAAAHQRGIAVVFHLHNFSYTDRSGFADA